MSYYSSSEKREKRRYIVGGCILWLIIAILFDHFIFTNSWYARLFALGNAKLSFDPFYRDFSHLSFTTFLLVPFLVVVVTLIILAIRKKIDKKDIGKSIGTIIWWSAFIIIAIVVGHIIYRLISGIDWKVIKVITNFCEGYKIEGQIYLLTLPVVTIKSGVGALVGFVIGVYCYYKKGVLKFLLEKVWT